MRQNQASLELLSTIDASGTLARPVPLDPALLAHVAGGGPNGGWSTVNGPNGGWTATVPGRKVTPNGPNGGWI